MTTDETDTTLDQLMRPGSTLMVGTRTGEDIEFHPLTVARVEGGTIDILLDTDEEWVRRFDPTLAVEVTMGSDRDNTWVWLTGRAECLTDDALIDELWSPFAAAYFDDGRDTPGIAVLRIDATGGRYWSTASGRIGSLLSMVRAALGSAERSGEHGSISIDG